MQTLVTELDKTIASWGPEAAAALKRSRNKNRFRAAVERTWRLRPDVGRFVLMHTNGIYIAKDERPRRGPDRHKDWWVFGMYLDDAMARTEVDAWQSVLLMNLEQEGFTVNELRFLPAKWDMRRRKLFPELWEEGKGEGISYVGEEFKYQDEARALDIVKRAVCLVFKDTELAWALLEKVKGASLREVFIEDPTGTLWIRDGKRHGDKKYRLFLYVEDPAGMDRIVKAYSEEIRSHARLLGLRITSIWVYEAPSSLRGQHAFQRIGSSIPLRDEVLLETEDEVEGVADSPEESEGNGAFSVLTAGF